MIKNLKIKKRLMQLGLTSVAIVNGAISLGCTQIKITDIPEPTRIESIEPEETKEVEVTPEITEEPTIVPTETPSPTPTEEPTPTPYDPYELTDEEAIEMGSYIYDNYIARYVTMEDTFFNKYAYRCQKQDIINLVCLVNQRPVVYSDRYSWEEENYVWYNTFFQFVADICIETNMREGKIEHFPYSLFMKEGRPERELLEELETGFDYISNNDVSNEEIYKWWGKAFKLAINSDETLKDWNTFNLPLFYYYMQQQYYQMMLCNDKFDGFDFLVPAKYIFNNDKVQKLNIDDAFYYNSTTNRNTYGFLTDEEYDSYIGCMDKIIVTYILEYDKDNPLVKEKEKDGN